MPEANEESVAERARALIALMRSRVSKPKKILLLTDLSRDVDDLTLLCILVYLHQLGLVEIVGVVTTHMIAAVRARVLRLLLKLFNLRHDIIAEGSDYPIGRVGDLQMLADYEEEHSLFGMSYEGLGLEGLDLRRFAMFRKPSEVILNAIEDHPGELNVFVVAPATDLAHALQHNIGVFERGGIQAGFWQGQATWDAHRGHLVADSAAYNMSVDMRAANIVFAETCGLFPWTLLGKWTARSAPLYREDFEGFAATGHAVGRYLRSAAEYGLMNFALKRPKIYSGIYAHGKTVDPDDPLKDAWYWSTPYDPTTALALLLPEVFSGETVGSGHTLIGMREGEPGLNEPPLLKEIIMQMVHGALTFSASRMDVAAA